MGEATFTFRVDDNLKSAFAELAKAEDRTSAQLLRALMRREVAQRRAALEHDAWFRSEVEQAVREADDPMIERIPNEIVEAEWAIQRAELVKRAKG
jgi:predicted transcriptional regulator